jgi:hypothetical protein
MQNRTTSEHGKNPVFDTGKIRYRNGENTLAGVFAYDLIAAGFKNG